MRLLPLGLVESQERPARVKGAHCEVRYDPSVSALLGQFREHCELLVGSPARTVSKLPSGENCRRQGPTGTSAEVLGSDSLRWVSSRQSS